MWWTQWSSRSTSIPVDIEYSGNTDTVYINQKENGGQWNNLGRYYFESGRDYRVTITAQPGPSSTCADAVRFVYDSSQGECFLDTRFEETVLSNNMEYYTDRTYTLTSVPSEYIGMNAIKTSEYIGMNAIKTPNDDRNLTTESNYLTFEMPENATVYVAFDQRAVNLPNWLDDFSYTGNDIQTSLSTQQYLRVYSKPYSAGDCINLGANKAPGFSGETVSNYIVFYGDWKVSSGLNPYNTDSFYSKDGSTFTWTFSPEASGEYEVAIWWTHWSSRSTNIPVEIEYSGNTDTVYINQQENGGQWNNLGRYYFESGEDYRVTITAQPGPSSTCADAVKFSFNYNDPFVRITNPYYNYLQTSSSLLARADAGNLPDGWGTEFVLDLNTANEQIIRDFNYPYEVEFSGLEQDEHTLDVFIIDNSYNYATGPYTHDQITHIGTGNYYVAMGDSITAGYGDDDASDNASQDGRNIGGGYEPILNDLLTIHGGFPHNILNKGIGGTTSADGLSSINDLLLQNPEADHFLVQYGTNDARPWLPVPSGKGLSPGDSGYPGTFKDNMQRIIDAINNAGIEVCLAKPPITLGDTTDSTPYANPDEGARSLLVKEYNQVVDELKNDPLNNIAVTPPDFYNYFYTYDTDTGRYFYEDQYADNLHPNGTGYRSMADLWFEALTQ